MLGPRRDRSKTAWRPVRYGPLRSPLHRPMAGRPHTETNTRSSCGPDERTNVLTSLIFLVPPRVSTHLVVNQDPSFPHLRIHLGLPALVGFGPYGDGMTQQDRDASASITERARLRSTALLEPFESSLSHLQATSLDAPVVPLPSVAQSTLEGLVLTCLGDLYDPTRETRRQRNFVVTNIRAASDHLELNLVGSQVAAALCGLLPAWEVGSHRVDHGIPGLRYAISSCSSGIGFHLHGSGGLVTFTGISLTEFERARNAMRKETGMRSVSANSPLRQLEAKAMNRPRRGLEAASIVFRRLGLLMHPSVTAIDAWWNRAGRLAVELITDERLPDPMSEVLARMQSPYLAPRLQLVHTDDYHHLLSIEGSEAEIDVRRLMLRDAPMPPSRHPTIGRGPAEAL